MNIENTQDIVVKRKIIHIDMDAFYASVEQRDFPEYRGKPVIVGGRREERGVVAACSYEARQFGIHSAMPAARANKLCPDAIFLKPRFDVYRQVSKQIHEIFQSVTEFVEPLSLDEAYLDVTANETFSGSATLTAKDIKRRIFKQTGLKASAGVSYNKFLAKVASDMDKPDGLYLIRPEQAEAFLMELSIRKFFGIGPATEAKMKKLGIERGEQLREKSLEQLLYHFGKAGRFYYHIVRGHDPRPVNPDRLRKSIGKEITFSSDITNRGELLRILDELSAKVFQLMINKGLSARTVTLKVKYSDFKLITRSYTEEEDISGQQELTKIAGELLEKTEAGKRKIRLLGISASNLRNRSVEDELMLEQLSLI